MTEETGQSTEGTTNEVSPEVEAEAKNIGWSPKEEWRGNPEKWVDAETFVRRGKEILPILQANNKKLQAKLDEVSGKLGHVTGQLAASQEAIEALKEFNTESTRQEAERTKAALVVSLKDARAAGDIDTEITLRDQIEEVNTVLKDSTKEDKKEEPKVAAKPEVSPEIKAAFEAWNSKNPWFGTDVRKTRLANMIGDELRADPKNANLVGEAFLDRIVEEVEKTLGGNEKRSEVDKVEGSRGGGNNRQGNGKTYADLPADAKEACAYYAKRLVGEGRGYKTEADWQKAYTSKYFAEGAA